MSTVRDPGHTPSEPPSRIVPFQQAQLGSTRAPEESLVSTILRDLCGGERKSSSPQTASATKRVLVIDDDPGVADVITALIESQGHLVTKVNRAPEGLQAVMKTDFDAVICDMVMPAFPGNMFYLAVSKVRPELCERFIFITGHSGDPAVRTFLRLAGQPVLYKPIAMDDLLELLASVFERGPVSCA